MMKSINLYHFTFSFILFVDLKGCHSVSSFPFFEFSLCVCYILSIYGAMHILGYLAQTPQLIVFIRVQSISIERAKKIQQGPYKFPLNILYLLCAMLSLPDIFTSYNY